MKSIRNYAYAAALALTALNFAPAPASAQEASGSFTLTHEVHWQNTIVPAGTYRFTLGASGPREVLTLRKTSGGEASFMLLVEDEDASTPSDGSQLVIVSRSTGRFVSALKIPAAGTTLNFSVPSESRELAKATTITTATGTR